jgi:Lar family restriction alleviation protein
MAKKYDLKPCPFCNSKDLINWKMLGSDRFYNIMCRKCGAMGPQIEQDHTPTAIRSISEAWNRRINSNDGV